MKLLLENNKNSYVSPMVSIMELLSEDVITASSFTVGDEKYDVSGDAVPFD